MVVPLNAMALERLGLEPDETVAWRFHITTELIDRLLVDKLTTESGEPFDTYLATFFMYPEDLRLTPYDVAREGEPA